MLARESMPHVAERWLRRRIRDHALETSARVGYIPAQGVKPTLGFLLETVETAVAWTFVGHGTFLQFA